MAERTGDAEITAWALAAGNGDWSALTCFIRATQRDVYRLHCHLGSVADAEDLTQETYLRACGSLPRFAGDAPARVWLLSIARRVAADEVRRKLRRPRTDATAELDDLGAQRSADNEVALLALIAELEPDRREAFVLTQILDLRYAEAAEICGCPIGTIRSRVARARQDLVAALTDDPRRRHA